MSMHSSSSAGQPGPGDDDGDAAGQVRPAAALLRAARSAALKQCLPIGLLLAIVFGLALPVAGVTVASATVAGRGVVQTLCVWAIFLISGLTLRTDDVRVALTAWRAILFGAASILFITPLLAPAVGALPLPLPRELSTGFVLFCAMPTTINSGVALVVQAKGSFALALALTLITNLLGVLTVPFFLSLVLQLGGTVRISAVDLLLRLLLLILAPLLLGKAARELLPAARRLASARKQQLTLASNGCLALIPWMELSQSRDDILSTGGGTVALVLALALLIHCVYLAWHLAAVRALRLPAEQARAVVIMGSQKTLPMAMAILAALPPSVGSAGLVAIPPIVCHLTQIFVDAWLAARWALRDPLALPIAALAEGPPAPPAKAGLER